MVQTGTEVRSPRMREGGIQSGTRPSVRALPLCTGNLRTMCECVDSHFCVSSVQTAMVLSSTDWENVSHVLRWLQGAFTQM